MRVVRGFSIGQGRSNFVAIGSFDGVHRAHQALIRRTVDEARQAEANSIVLTFDPHPLQVINPGRAPLLLTTFAEKVAAIEALDPDYLLVVPFTPELARQNCTAFARQILQEGLQARRVLVGFNFTFGYRGAGTPETLAALGKDLGFAVEVLPPVQVGAETVSSTLIREKLSLGEVRRAAELLGRPYEVRGQVVRGHGRGRDLGVPTANLVWPDGKAFPARGVYAVRVEQGGAWYFGVANFGRRPTFGPNGAEDSLEVHLLDFSGELYGKYLTVQFLERLREERTFSAVPQLLDQIKQDIGRAREILGQEA